MVTPAHSSLAGLYLHVPFCTTVCPYCDFAVTIAGEERRAGWASAIVREAELHSGCGLTFDSVYFGGGTPSSVETGQLTEILTGIRNHLDIAENAQVFLEVNPEDVTTENVSAWRRAGVRVVSLGVQSFDDDALAWLGRGHSGIRARRAAEFLLGGGFDSVSIDLIFGHAGQTAEAWKTQLEEAVALGVDHFSCYQLTFHEETVFGRRLQKGLISRLPEETESELFFLTHSVLSEAGYEGYEVSNFASAPRHRSRHNQKYWDHTPYLGLGPSAHSWAGGRRWWNLRKVRLWQREVDSGRLPTDDHEQPSARQLTLEALMLGLRTTDGVDLDIIRDRFGIDLVGANLGTIERLDQSGHLEVDGRVLRPTLNGLAIADTLARAFVLPD